MAQDLSSETEHKIIEAAKRVFLEKGRSGASMQDIADEAGINRTLLNYYFRSKDKLFDLIFEDVFLKFIPEVADQVNASNDVMETFNLFIDKYFDILHASPLTPVFILHELTTNPERLVRMIKSRGIEPQIMIDRVQAAMNMGIVKKTDPRHLFVSLISLVVFPFAARPILMGMLFQGDMKAYDRFLLERKDYVKDLFMKNL